MHTCKHRIGHQACCHSHCLHFLEMNLARWIVLRYIKLHKLSIFFRFVTFRVMLLPPARPNDERHTVCFRKFAGTESHSRFPVNSAAVLSDGETAGQASNEVRGSSHACRPLVDISEHILLGIHRGFQSRRAETLACARRRAIPMLSCHRKSRAFCGTADNGRGEHFRTPRHEENPAPKTAWFASGKSSPTVARPSTSTPCCSHHTSQGACSFAQNIETERVPI